MLYCNRRLLGQFVLVSGPLLGWWPDFKIWVTIIFFLLHVGHPLWWEDGSEICSAITHRLESCKTHNHILLLSHLRLPQPGGPGPGIYIPQEQGSPVIPPDVGFATRCSGCPSLICYWIAGHGPMDISTAVLRADWLDGWSENWHSK
jgi:hypothetical protein